ncbi:HalOD1 output domain-containing protein [Halohasta litorea]|uniref:HalOD1 output domain-containing protein n=1 Tax=Halohasta litorea TaxID=869891 RepID=A0ABD6D8P0_9EURY|nr:HalOD1 output domain-containing protein [Halohasta litorea]MEA1931123.1 HalOD1 output domain-containing protein [Euryarchaeota archaeon]
MIEDISPGTHEPTDRSDTQTHRFRHDPQEQSIVVSIIRAVASVSGIDPLSVEPRLYDVVDPDALETLLGADSAGSDLQVSFPFGSCAVTVTAAGTILVHGDTAENCGS